MKAVVITKTGGYESVRAQGWPDPVAPGAGQIRIAVRAAGANFADTLARVGLYPDAPRLPTVLGYEVSGIVESVGPGVDRWVVGDRVIAATRFGGQAELALARADDCLRLPEQMTFEQGAAFLVSYATAWTAAMIMGGLRRGERLLVHSAGGGTGAAATQVGRAAGACVIGTASAHKHARVLANGAQHVFDYHDPDFASEILRVTDGRGVDVILDPLGPTTFRDSYRKLLRPGGRLVMYGMSEVQVGERVDRRRALTAMAKLPFVTMPWWKSAAIFSENKGVFALNMLSWWDQEGSLRRVLEPLEARLAKGIYEPVVAKAFPFSRAAEAHRYLQEARNFGKVVLVPDRAALRPDRRRAAAGTKAPASNGGRATPVRRRRDQWAALLVAIAVTTAAAGTFYVDGRRATAVPVTDAVARFRDTVAEPKRVPVRKAKAIDAPSGPKARAAAGPARSTTPAEVPREAPAARRAIAAPAPGVYVYSTTGYEEVSVLGGARHTYPDETTITVKRTPCGADVRWDGLEERWDEWTTCSADAAIQWRGFLTYHEFFGQIDRKDYDCSPTTVLRPGSDAVGTSFTGRCVGSGARIDLAGRVVGVEDVRVGETTVRAVRVHIDERPSGATKGRRVYDSWYQVGTNLLVRRDSRTDVDSKSAFGYTHYIERLSMVLSSLTPRR